MTIQTIRPGILVSLHTTVNGGVRYARVDLDATADAAMVASTDTASIAVWKTTKEVADPAEHAAAEKARNRARKLVRAWCIETSFGLICTEANAPDLDRAIADAVAVAAEHNANAKWSRVGVYVLRARIADNDEQAARAISSEVRGMLAQMDSAVSRLDVKSIREAADRAKRMEALLAPELAVKASEAIAAARQVARDIVKRVSNGADIAAVVLSEAQRSAIDAARVAFADIDLAPAVVEGEALPAVDLDRVAEVDMEAASVAPAEAPAAPVSSLDLALMDVDDVATFGCFDPLAALDMDLDLAGGF